MESSTKILRRMLDERGVEWWNQTDPEPQTATMARLGDQLIEYHENVNGTMGYHVWNMCDLTPEQAIAATLGRDNVGRYVGLCQGKYWERTENSDYYCGGCGWKVTDHDSFCPECGGALHKTTLGRGECRNASKVMDEHGQAHFACSECHAWIDSRMLWNPEYRNGESPWVSGCKLNYCPNCGRRIVGPTTNAEVDA